jgi:hypothetical protein
MDKDLATLILSACHRSASELAEIAPLISRHCSEEDLEVLRLPLGRCIHDVLENVAGHVARRCPEAQAEFDALRDTYGRTI